MGFTDLFADVISSLGFAEVQAEAPPAEDNDSGNTDADQEDKPAEESSEDNEESSEDEEKQSEEGEAEEEEPEEEEEEEEAEDIKPKLEEDCANSNHCAPYKHHFDECVERVTSQQEDPDFKGPKEDCVEEFFHLQHCATQCAAPKLWKTLR